jgi:hypothetical protein
MTTNYPTTHAEKKAFWAAKKAEMEAAAATPVVMTASVETPESIRKARVEAKLAELNAKDAAKSNHQ